MNDDFEKLAQRYGVPLPKTPDVDQVSHLLKRMRDSVETQESGGRQGIRNPRTDATGLFQVMPANIAPWTKKYVGRAMSQDEFIRDKDAQEKVFQGEMGSYLRQALKRTDNEDEAIRMGAAAWYGGPDDMHRYDDPKRFRPDEPSFREYTTSVLGRIKKTPQAPQVDFDKLSSRYLQGNEFSTLAERYGVAPTQVEGQKPLLRPGQPLGTDLPPTNPTGVALKTGVTDAPPVQPPVQSPLQPVQPAQPPVQRPIEPRKVARPTYATGEPVISDESYDEQGNVIPPTTNLSTGTFTRDTSGGAVADLIEIPKSVKTANEANEYVKGQLRAKYGNIKIPDNFTFSKTWTPGTGAAVDYATLKQMGVDTDALVSEQIAQQRVGREQAPDLKMPVMPEAEAEKALDERIRSTDYAGQQRMAEFISNPANLILPIALWNSYNQQGDVLTDDWVASQKKRMLDQYGSYGKALQAEEYYKNSDWAETISRIARQTAGSFAKNLFSGTAKSIATLGQEFEDANPLNLVLPDKAKIGVRNLVNGADFLTRLMTAPSAQDAVNEMEWASGNDISKQQLYKAAQEFDKAIGDDPVLKGRFLGSLADAGGSALAFVALGAVMPAMRTTNFWGKTRDWSTAIAGAVQSAGSGYEEGKSQGLSEADARKFGVIQGLLGTSEMVGAGSELTSFLKDPTLRRQIASALLEVGKGVKREAKQEFAQEVFQTTSGRAVLEYLKDNDPSTLQKLTNALNKLPIQIAEAVTNEGITAAITGGLMGGAGTAAQVQSAETAEPIVQPAVQEQPVSDTLKTVDNIDGTQVEAKTTETTQPVQQDVSKKTENIDTSTERVDTVNIPEAKPLTVIPEKKGKRQDKVEFKTVVPEEQASQTSSEPKPLTTIPEKKRKAKVESKAEDAKQKAERTLAQDAVSNAASIALHVPGDVLSQLTFGKESLGRVDRDVHQFTNEKRGKTYKFNAFVYDLEDGRQRVVLSTDADSPQVVDAGAVIRKTPEGVVVETIHGGHTGFPNLGGVLARYIQRNIGKVIPDMGDVPLSQAGKRATQKLQRKQILTGQPEAKQEAPKVEFKPSEVAPPVEQATLRTVEDIPIVGTDVEAGTKVRLKPQDVSIKPENIDTSTERVDTVNIPEQKPLTGIPDKQGKRQDRIEFKEPEAKPLATIPEKKGKRQDKVAFQNQKTAPLQTIPEKGNQKTVVLDSPKQERKKAPSVAELKQTEKGLDELYGKIDIAKDSTDYGYTSNQLAKIGALIDITPEGQKLTALKQREAEIQANHKIATKQYSQALKEREKVEKKAKAQWQNEAEKLTNDELIAKYNELFYPAMGNIVTRDELVRKEIEKRGLTDKIGQGVDPFKKLARTGEKAVNESSGIRWVLDRMVNADQVKGALDYAKSLTYEGEQYLPSNLLWDISQNKYADEATKKEARQLYDKAMGVVSTPREQLHAEKEKERAQRYAKKKITAPPKPAPVTPIQADDEVSWVQDGQTQTGIVQKVSGLSAVIEDAAGDTHRVLLTSLKRPDVIEFKSVPQKTPKRDRPSQPALVTEGKEFPKPEKDNVIRDGDIINNGVKTGIYREIDGKKRVQFYGGTPTISNTTEYKEGKWEKGEGDLMESARPEFYSQLERTIEQKMPAKASAEQVRGIIKDTKQEERDWLGIDQWLDEHPTATKEEVLQFVRENNAKIEVVEKGKSVYQPQFDITQSEDTQGNPIWQVKLNGKFLTALKRERFPTEDDVQNYASRHYRDANIQETDDTKFSQYVLPGGENYREMLLTLPPSKDSNAWTIDRQNGKYVLRKPDGTLHTDSQGNIATWSNPTSAEAAVRSNQRSGDTFKSSHFDEPNILVHIRFDDRAVDGKKILHIAEIQSDWHQAGRKKGYAPSPAEITKAKDLVDTTRQALQSAIKARDAAREPMIESLYLDGKKVAEIDINKGETFGNYLTRIDKATWDAANLSRRDEVDFRSLKNNFDENAVEGRWNIRRSYALSESERDTQTRLNEANRAYNRAVEALQKLNGEVPDAPFKKSWHELALKKALHYAVTNGYDAISWDTGETQADRYDLSKQIKEIEYIKRGDKYELGVTAINGDGVDLPQKSFTADELENVVGKEVAQKIIDGEGKQYRGHEGTTLEGLDLKVGGEGMRGFYDKILPAFANKYTKKWGGKVTEGIAGKPEYVKSYEGIPLDEIRQLIKDPFDPYTVTTTHQLNITPAMRESVMQGQPMFAVRQSDVQANERSFENAKKLDIEELLPLVDMKDIEHTDEGILEVNDIPAYELVRRTLATAMNASPDFNGVFTDPDQVNAFVNTAERLAGQADAVGQDGQKFRDLAKMVKQVAKTDGSVIFLLSKEALPHEIVHKTFYFTRDPNKTRENQIPTDQLEAMAQTPIFKHIQRALGWRSYKKKKLATQMEEAATHIVRGEWDVLNIDTEEQTRDAARLALAYLKAFAKQNAREGKSEDDILKILAKEITYAEEVQKYIQLEGVQAEREADVQGAEDSNVRPTRRGTGETVSEKYRPSGEERLSQTPISAREKANIPLKDDPYISASNATQQDFANTQLAKGLDKATDWFNSQVEDGNLNNGATGVVGLNLLNAYAQQGRYAEMDAVAEKLVPMIRSAAQSVQAMRILAKFNPEKALAYATMRKMARTGLPLTDREINRLTPKIENLNNAEIDKAAVETAITELQNALERANAEIADLEQAIKDAEKPTTETKESVTKKIPTKRELRSREELEKAIRKSYGTDLMESVRDDSRQDIVDLIALDILDYKTPAETLEHIEVLTGNALTQEEFASLQLEAWNSLRPPAISRSAEQQAKLDARTAHRRLAFQTRGQKQGPKKPNVFEREVLAQGTELGYTEQEITGAILLPQLRGDNARQQWYQAMGGHNPELFKRSFDLRQTVLKNIRDQRAQAKAEREGFTGSLGQFENELRHRDMALREARLQLQREYDKIERSTGEHLLYGVEEAVNLFKGLSAWGEVSYILRQGFIPLVTDTRAALKGDWQGVGHGLQGDNELWKWIGDKAGFDQAVQYLGDHSLSMFISKIRQHPRFLEAQNNGVRFTQIGDFNIADDHFSTKLLEAVPLYKRAEVAYTLPGDLQRLFIYDSWAKYIEGQNLSEVDERKAKKYAAETANAFTGKGNIAKLISREGALAKLASITFFSPQLLISRFQSAYRLSTGFATAPKGMRLQMAKKGARFYGLLALMLYLAGASLDPEDDDFGTLNVKKDSRLAKAIPDARDLHIDMLAGLDVPIQNGLRLFMGLGKAVMNNDRAYFNDAVLASWRQLGVNKQGEPRFLRSKLSPSASMIADWYTGKDYLGRPFSYWGAISSRVSPLAWQQTYDALLYDRLDAMKTEKQTPVTAREKLANERKWDNALVMLLGTFTGVGITQYPKDEKSKAMELASTLSDAVSKKDDETRRVEGVLRKLFKAQQEALVDGGNTSKVNAEINDWINKHPQLKSETKRLLGEAKSKTGLFSYYVKDLTLPELQRVQKVATGDELEVVNQMIKKVEKKKK